MVKELSCTFEVYVNKDDGQYYYRRVFSRGWALTNQESYEDAEIEVVSKMIGQHLQQNMNTYMQFSCTIDPLTGEYDIDRESLKLSKEYDFRNRKLSDSDRRYGKIPHGHASQYRGENS